MRDDDRPRGFEPDRMRRLWSDIDRSRDNLGLGTQPIASSSPWSVGAVVGYAAGLATDAVDSVLGWTRVLAAPMRVLAAPSRMLTLPTRVLTAPTRAIGEAVPCVRRLPIVGGLFE